MYTLIIIWTDGSKEEYSYNDRQTAEQAAHGYEIAFGQQVWTGIRREA